MKQSVSLILIALVLLLCVAISSIFIGSTNVSPITVLSALNSETALNNVDRTILLQLRLPRMLTAIIVGGSLAAAGVGFQGLFRNPLAEPYVIGASSGASLGVAIVIVCGLRASLFTIGATTLLAMLGAITVVMLVLAVGTLARAPSTMSLLLAGVVFSCMANALVSALMFLFDQKAVVILSWLMGSFANSHWGTVSVAAIICGSGVLLLGLLSRALDAFSLGDTASQSLGLDLRHFRWVIIGAASIATAGAVAASGVIGFVGLISPHIARLLVGSRHAVLIPMSVTVGALLTLIADMIARTVIAPAELPVGIVTAILGCPFFLWLLLSDRRSGAILGGAT